MQFDPPPCPHGKANAGACEKCQSEAQVAIQRADELEPPIDGELVADDDEKGVISPKANATGLYRGQVDYDD